MSDTNVKMVCACSRCGSLRVQITAWLEANSDRLVATVEDGPSEDTWCPECEENTGYEYRAGIPEELAIWEHQKLLATLQRLNSIRPDLFAVLASKLSVETVAEVFGAGPTDSAEPGAYAERQALVADRRCEACNELCDDPDWRTCHSCGHVLGQKPEGPEPESLKIEGYGVEITMYRSQLDGTPVVEIDTPEDVTTPDGQPKLRVFINDGEVYENPSYADVIAARERAEQERES